MTRRSVQGPVVSVVIPTAGRADLLETCLSSLEPPRRGGMEIVVVASGPRAGTLTACQRSPWPVRCFRLAERAGFAAAVNAGLEEVRGRYVLVLNDDACAAPGFVDRLVEAAETTGAALVAPRILSMEQPDRIDNTGNSLYRDGLNLCRGRGEPDGPAHRVAVDPLLPSGAAMLIRRSMLTRIGAFETAFHSYGEDADLGMRALRARFSTRYAPDAVVYHLGGGTWGADSLRKAFLVERNRARLAAIHLPLGPLARSPLNAAARYLRHASDGLRGGGPMSTYSGPGQRLGAGLAAAAALAASLTSAPSDIRLRSRACATSELAPSGLREVVERRVVGLSAVGRRRRW